MSELSVALSPNLPAAGRPAAYRVESPAGLVIEPDQLAGRAFLLWYEGPKTAALNDEAKARLIAVLHALPPNRRVQLVAVGDVSRFAFWPARSFAKRLLAKNERKYGHPIYADWQGRMRLRYGLAKDQSNLLFVDEAGVVRYRATGKVPEADLEQVAGLIRGAL